MATDLADPPRVEPLRRANAGNAKPTPVARLERQQRRGERARLGILLQWLAAHAIVHQRGQPVTAELVTAGERAVGQLLADVAEDGHLLHFGIRDAADLGDAPVALYLTDDPRYPYGTTALELLLVVDWIMGGGARGRGWKAPGELAVDDLAPPSAM